MKKKPNSLFFVLVILTIPGLVFSQWTHSFECNKPLNKVFTLDLYHAYTVGPNGVFFRTLDGGFSWEQVQTGTTKQLFDVQFIDPSTGFLCGESGTLLKSTDGGNSWNSCTTNTTLHVRSICFINNNTGWISCSSGNSLLQLVADSGVILKTTNGGNSFTICQRVDAGVQKVTVYNQDTCLAICNGYTGNGSFILRTTNSGTTWQTAHIAWCVPLTSMETFPSGLTYVSCTYSYLYKTTDFGILWDSTSFTPGQIVTDLSFPSPLIGYTAGFDPLAMQGYVYNTTDGGQSWTLQLFDHYFCSVSFCNDTIGFVVANNGTIFKHGVIDGINPNLKTNGVSVKVFPNPITSSINIEINEKSINQLQNPYVIEIYSIKGDILMEKFFNEPKFKITNLQFLTPGQYSIVIKNRTMKLYSAKFVKKD